MITLNWGILGTGAIAKSFASHLPKSRTGKLLAVASRKQETADAFAMTHSIPKAYPSYEALLADPEVQAVYIATPHPLHAQLAIAACAAKKHVLVEKPISLNAGQTMAVLEAAEAHGVLVMEAFMYRCHPQTLKLVELIRAGVIGQVRSIQASFSFHWPKEPDPASRLLSNELAGGGILDVGCYPVSFARLVAGVAMGKPFAEPMEVKAVGHLGATGVDEWTSALLKFPGDVVAQVSCGVQLQEESVARIYGTEGWLLLPAPWVPAREGGEWEIVQYKGKDLVERHGGKAEQPLYAIEADAFSAAIPERKAVSPAMAGEDSLGNMRVLDAWRAGIGLVYEQEKAGRVAPLVIPGRPAGPMIPHGKVPGVSKTVSRLVIGCDSQVDLPLASVMFDDFLSRGGNCFDTSYHYNGGRPERLLGQWMKARGVRDQVALIVKGAHSPNCFPDIITAQLEESFDRMQIDRAEIYMMHRDNPAVPVGEFVEVLNEHLKAGRIQAFGGSNWSIARVKEANAYAKAKGLTGFNAVSNNFSLARMVNPVWAGCITASDAESRAFFTQTQTPLFAWSSQARGFFLEGKASPNDHSDAELSNSWYSADNFQRLARTIEVAKMKNTRPINIALAYVLAQPFPTFALIGPRSLAETRTSLAALDLVLTQAEVQYLNLERDTA